MCARGDSCLGADDARTGRRAGPEAGAGGEGGAGRAGRKDGA